jgi:hypothetical protein
MAAFTSGTYPTGLVANTRPTTTINSDERQAIISLNALLTALSGPLAAMGGAEVPITTGALSRGTTVTLATAAQVISVNAVSAGVAAQTGQALGALGTIPASKWGVILVQRVLAGTTTFVSGASNYTTGYDSEAAALAALPAATADRVHIGHITVLASASTWIAGTDALAGGTGGNPATTTNYYNVDGVADAAASAWATVKQIANQAGTVITSSVG